MNILQTSKIELFPVKSNLYQPPEGHGDISEDSTYMQNFSMLAFWQSTSAWKRLMIFYCDPLVKTKGKKGLLLSNYVSIP